MNQINFVRHRRRELTKVELQDSRNFKYGLYAFGAVIILLLITMGVRLFLANQIKRTTAETDAIREEIRSKQAIEDEYLVLMKKVQMITDLFGQRREKQQALAYFSSLFDPEVIVSQLSYDADTHTLSFTLRAPHIFSMKKVFDTLLSANVKEKYPTFSVGKLSRSIDASYSMDIVLPLPTRPIIAPEAGATILLTPDEAGSVGTSQELIPISTQELP